MKSTKKAYPHRGKDDIYNYYHSQFPRNYNTGRKQFKRVIDKFNQRIIDRMLEGAEFNPANQLGKFRIVRVKRNFSKPTVDWKSSYEYKEWLEGQGYQARSRTQPGYDWLVFFTDDYYYRFYWRKQSAKVKNKSVYRFDPTDSNKKKLSQKAKTSVAFEFNIPNAEDV